jgi:hypothetical protein
MQYQDAAYPIRSRQHTVWILGLPSGEQRILVWAPEATIEDVHRHVSLTHEKFTLAQLGVGEHVIVRTDHSYMDDARCVDEAWVVGMWGEPETQFNIPVGWDGEEGGLW